MLTPLEVKTRIPHTWPLFFARHGRFTPIQQQTIPHILDGNDVLAIAATASGKTEAVIAPLLERYWERLKQPGLAILYICPTRALVRDLYERLQPILDDTDITLGMKTGDVTMARQMPAILLTTPESTDSLLTRAAKSFIGLQAIVLDEIHLFDNTPRGDHLRCLLPRIERIRQYANPEVEPAQRAALSATVPDPEGAAARYLNRGQIVQVAGGRTIEAEIRPLYNLSELINALTDRPAFKSLVFCNSREEVEQTAVHLRQQLPRHADIFVHYSNLDAAMRRDVEDRFAEAATAVCVCTSTLELGVDIGSVDDVVLLGAPPDLNSFMQRIGRGSRRANRTQALCMPKTPGEWARFEALLTLAQSLPGSPTPLPPRSYGFRPSVLIQQIFSLIRQSPTGSVRLADARRIAPPEITSDDIRKIVSELVFAAYLQPGRPGAWKPDEKLQELLDQHEIYTNIGADVMGITAVNAHTGRTIAHTDRSYPPGTVVLFGGKPMRVMWVERFKFGLMPAPGAVAGDILRFRKTYAAIPFAVTRAVAQALGLAAGQMAVLPQAPGQFLFHFWGTVWGELLTAVLVVQGISAESVNEYCLHINQPIAQLPPIDASIAQKAARDIIITLTNRLEMGRYHRILPTDIAQRAVLQQLDLNRFKQIYDGMELAQDGRIHEQLHQLLSS
ncbi:MAG: DEAD/DEAH box helicase [Chloroflexi bacterium]|nr:DEAD/DEAH box helicase [Chloroflexota bacterium]